MFGVRAIAFLAALAAMAQEPTLPAPGTGIERTMTRLAACTPGSPDHIRILFYGQSITKQAWWREVAADLGRRFPACRLTIENRAIGGYSTPRLIRTLEADVLPFHPDLVIFHDYGQQDLYEKIIRWIRSHTTADVLLQSDHVVWLPGEDDAEGSRRKSYDFQERHSFEWLPALARKYELGLVNMRGGWHEHLKKNSLAPKALLRDNVHLNQAGEALYAELTKKYFVPTRPVAPHFHEIAIGPDHMARSNEVNLDFTGTRVELMDGIGGPLQVLIDGKPPALDANLYYHSRPTNTWAPDWPTIMRIGRAPNAAAPLVEEWTLKVTEKLEVSGLKHRYELFGSVTGPDGAASNEQAFRSRSGRVTIAPEDFDIERAYGLNKVNMPNSWQVRWSTLPRFLDPYIPAPGAVTIVYGLEHKRHRLTLRGTGKVSRIRIYTPPLAVE
jgi:hypothetical protein